MRHPSNDDLPPDLAEIGDQLREDRPGSRILGQDGERIDARIDSSRASARRGARMSGTRLSTAFAVVVLATGMGAATGIAKNSSGHGNADDQQYGKNKPGCGPKKSNGVNPSGTHTG